MTGRGLTDPQMRALQFLVELSGTVENPRTVMPRQLALHLWPDSPTWKRRNRNGAMGGTMPMKAATLLWKLKDHGYAYRAPFDRGWLPTAAGRDVVAAGNTAQLPIGEETTA